MEIPRSDSQILRRVLDEATARAQDRPRSTRDACPLRDGGSAPSRLDAAAAPPPRRRGAPQRESAPEPIRRAVLRLAFGDDPHAAVDEAAFTFDRKPHNHPALRGRAGRVAVPSAAGPVSATIALEPELRMLGANYRDAWHGLAPDAFSRGIVATTVAEKALAMARPDLPEARREVVAERVAYAAAGPHWAFRALMRLRAAQAELAAGRRPAERVLLLGVACLALHEIATVARLPVPAGRAIEAGAALCGAFHDWLALPGTFEAHPSYPAAFRAFARERFDLTPVTARALTSRFAARMESGTDALARSILAQETGAPPRAP
ncbi:MAG: hypothetical protein ACFE0R_16035 [Salinarimonas sp.]